jgi:glycerol-3-phosphate acyltransferase PlsY
LLVTVVIGYIALILGAYLLGSIPTGYIVARAKGIDIRKVGSGNIGATNVFRTLGKPAGIFVMLADGLKGYIACTLLMNLVFKILTGRPGDEHFATGLFAWFKVHPTLITQSAVAGFASILGHTFTCWLNFKGGKGIATSAGVYLGVALPAALIAMATWTFFFVVTRYVSLASIMAAVALSIGVWVAIGPSQSIALCIATTVLSSMVIWKHRSNIARLKAGTESRIVFSRKAGTGAKP